MDVSNVALRLNCGYSRGTYRVMIDADRTTARFSSSLRLLEAFLEGWSKTK